MNLIPSPWLIGRAELLSRCCTRHCRIKLPFARPISRRSFHDEMALFAMAAIAISATSTVSQARSTANYFASPPIASLASTGTTTTENGVPASSVSWGSGDPKGFPPTIVLSYCGAKIITWGCQWPIPGARF
jgi:hypothetical protein